MWNNLAMFLIDPQNWFLQGIVKNYLDQENSMSVWSNCLLHLNWSLIQAKSSWRHIMESMSLSTILSSTLVFSYKSSSRIAFCLSASVLIMITFRLEEKNVIYVVVKLCTKKLMTHKKLFTKNLILILKVKFHNQ